MRISMEQLQEMITHSGDGSLFAVDDIQADPYGVAVHGRFQVTLSVEALAASDFICAGHLLDRCIDSPSSIEGLAAHTESEALAG